MMDLRAMKLLLCFVLAFIIFFADCKAVIARGLLEPRRRHDTVLTAEGDTIVSLQPGTGGAGGGPGSDGQEGAPGAASAAPGPEESTGCSCHWPPEKGRKGGGHEGGDQEGGDHGGGGGGGGSGTGHGKTSECHCGLHGGGGGGWQGGGGGGGGWGGGGGGDDDGDYGWVGGGDAKDDVLRGT